TTSGASYTNVYTYRLNASGSVVTDSRAVSSNNLSAVSSAFNGSKDSAQTKINGAVICSADVKDGHIIWNHPMSGPVHSLVKVEEKKATCLSDGNTAYFHCGECGKNFADENGEKEISDSETTIAKLDANYAEETDSLIVYDGNWETINNLRNASGKALIRGFKSGSTVTFSFVGKSFGIIGYTSPTYGMISVQVDDNAAETIDLYSEEAAYQTPIYDRYVGDGVHKVTVTILNTKNASAGRTGLYYAAIDQIVTDGSLIPVDKKIDDIALTVTENTVSVVLPAPFVAGTPVENLQASAMNGTVEVISENTVVYTVSPLHVNDVITYTVNGFTGNVIVMYDTGILHQFENLEHTAPWRLFNSWYLDEHSAVYTATAGAEYSFTVTAAAIELIGYRSKTYSSFDVYVDGEYVKSVDEYAQSGYFYRENLGTVNLGENKTHTITIKANGRVILDAYRLSK
ncbi:MAG: hypothetical protein ACI4QV_03980, partial [Acutalibacteraceae bacterium]